MSLSTESALRNLAQLGHFSIQPSSREGVWALARGQTVFMVQLATAKWQEKRTKVQGLGLFSLFHAMGLDLGECAKAFPDGGTSPRLTMVRDRRTD